VLEFLRALSDRSRYLRFFAGGPNLERAATWAVDVDSRDRFGLVATKGDRIVAHASMIRTGAGEAEIAFEVADEMQGLGVGTVLLGHLAEAAADAGIEVLRGVVLPDNRRMIQVFRDSGFPIRTRIADGEVSVEMPASLSPGVLERFEEREHHAAIAAGKALLAPRSIAVLGASRRRGTIGGEVFHNLVTGGFEGPVYPVNPSAPVVQSVSAYPTVLDIPGPVDLGVVVVPAEAVVSVARECATKGVRGLVVISSGFAEVGGPGIDRQRELVTVCRETGMRLIGPNCMGIINTAEDVSMNATFAPAMPIRGRAGFMTQSGALGLAVIENAATLGLGLSSFVSVGNKADISGNDLIRYWSDDPDTDLILLYLESFGNPRTFSRIARSVGKTKPIIAVKSGRSTAGARATSSHTGALIAASDVTVEALFRQTGVVRTDTLAELFDVAALLANQPVPAGRRVAIVTNAGGPGIMCADACEAAGLEVSPLADDLQQRLRSFLAAEASAANPVDMIASAGADEYRRTIVEVAGSEDVDAIIVIFIRPIVTRTEDVARAIREAVDTLPRDVPLLAVFMSAHGVPAELRGVGRQIPSYSFPEDAARALAHVVGYGEWRARPAGTLVDLPDVKRHDAAALLSSALAAGATWLEAQQVEQLLQWYGVPVAGSTVAADPEAAARAAEEVGGRVALKAIAPTLVHKSDVGGVRLNLEPSAVADVAHGMQQTIDDLQGFLVQRMAEPGVEMLVGVVHDRSFGPVIACGAGGTAVELLKDVQVRLTPLTDLDAADMVRGLATYPLLIGYRGAPKTDVAGLEDILLRVSAMVEAHPEIAEMDLNPVIVSPSGAIAVDARVRIEAPPVPLPLSARRPA